MLAGTLSALLSSTIVAFVLLRPFSSSLGLSLCSAAGLAYFFGLGIITQVFMWLWVLGVPITVETVSFILMLIVLIALFMQRSIKNESGCLFCGKTRLPLKGIYLLAIFYVALNLVMIFLAAAALPVFAWDSITSEAYKAKTVFYTGSLTQLGRSFYPNFPFYTLSAMAWAMFGQGVWEDKYMHLIFALALLSFTFIFYDITCRLTGRITALVSLVLLFSSNLLVIHATLSYRDILMMVHTSLCVLGILLWGVEDKDIFVLFAALFAGLSLLTKIEALPYYPVYLALLLLTGALFKKNMRALSRNIVNFVAVSAFIYFPFYIYKTVVGTSDSGWAAPVICKESLLLRSWMVAERFFNEFFLWGNWNIFFWPLFVIAALIFTAFYFQDRLAKLLLIAVFLFFAVYAATFLFTGSFAVMREPYTVSRYFMHFYPLAVLVIARVFYLAYGQKNDITF